MKELSIEQKAKAYDEAIKRGKALYDNNQPISCNNVIIENIFPELKESGDEKIRKWLIALIKSNEYGSISSVGEMPCPKLNVLAWLEKQGNLMKALQTSNAEIGELIEKNYYLKEQLEKQGEQKSVTMSLDEAIEHCKEKSCGNNACALEHKQLESWLTELKELKEQKPVWSEEDEKIWKELIEEVKDQLDCVPAPDCRDKEDENVLKQLNKWLTWLKSLKDRVQPKQELNESGKILYNRTIGLLKQYANSDNEVKKQSALSCINWLKSVIKNEKTIKYKIGDKVRFYSNGLVFTISGIDEANERYISPSGDYISFYEELILVKSNINKDDIKCGDYLTTEDGTVIKVHDVDENECIHHFYYASKMTEDGGDISNNFMCYCAILSDCRRATQEEIDFLEKWIAHKKYVWVKNNVSPYDEEDD